MNEENKVLELKNITKTFGSIIANKNVNLDLYKGEILSILGENGSGKTTAMNIISGIYAQEEGDIYAVSCQVQGGRCGVWSAHCM